MPGIALCFKTHDQQIKKALQQPINNGFSLVLPELNVGPTLFVAAFSYPGYPFFYWQRGEHLVFMEGKTYPMDHSANQNEFFSWFLDEGFNLQKVENWRNQQDGEYVIVLINKKINKGILINDRFGRLPLYLFHENEKWCISREIGFVRNLAGKTRPDKLAMAENLLFGYPLGNKTFDESIKRLMPASMLQLDLIGGKIETTNRLIEWEASRKLDQKQTQRLLETLQKAISDRISENDNPALSLSGGLDSRLIAALLKNQDIDIPWLTYNDAEGSAAPDVVAAQKIAEGLNHSDRFKVIELPPTRPQSVSRLLQLKQGMNGADMAFLLPFLENFKLQHWQMLTGDGGDKTLESLKSPIPLLSSKQLIMLLLWKHHAPPPESVARVLGLKKEVILDSVLASLNSLPPKNLNLQYESFMVNERAAHWLFEGEDRNRAFCWATTPFYQPDFWETAMAIRMSDKAYGKLFLDLFQMLPGKLHEIENPNWKLAPLQRKGLKFLEIKQALKAASASFLGYTLKNEMPDIELTKNPHLEWFSGFTAQLNQNELWQRAAQEPLSLEVKVRLLSIILQMPPES